MTTKLSVNTQMVKIEFYGQEMAAVECDGKVYVSVRHICQNLGIDKVGQVQRIKRNRSLAKGGCIIQYTSTGGPQETFCLELKRTLSWLATININKIGKGLPDDERQQLQCMLERYQDEAADALEAHFRGGQPTQSATPAQQLLAQAQIMVNLEEQQREWISKQRRANRILRSHHSHIKDQESRLGALEVWANSEEHKTTRLVKSISHHVAASLQSPEASASMDAVENGISKSLPAIIRNATCPERRAYDLLIGEYLDAPARFIHVSKGKPEDRLIQERLDNFLGLIVWVPLAQSEKTYESFVYTSEALIKVSGITEVAGTVPRRWLRWCVEEGLAVREKRKFANGVSARWVKFAVPNRHELLQKRREREPSELDMYN